MTVNESRQLAKQMTSNAVEANAAKVAKIKAVAEALKMSYEKAEAMVEGEIKRKEASTKYRKSDAYKNRLEQQKVVRAMLKSNN